MEERKETFQQRIVRKSSNCCHRLVGMGQKAKPLVRAKYKLTQLNARKRRFGTQYMNMVDRGASEDELRQCIVDARKELDIIQQDIEALHAAAARIDDRTNQKFVRKPQKIANADIPHVVITNMINDEELEYVTVPTPLKPTAPLEEDLKRRARPDI